MINDFDDAQDARMKDTATKIMETKKVTPEQSSEVTAWLVLTVLTIKKALWSPADLDAAIDERMKTCSKGCEDKFKTACDSIERILSKPWPWLACFSPFIGGVIEKIAHIFGK